jgi:hypothetical protein
MYHSLFLCVHFRLQGAFEVCVKEVVASQCGSTLANTLSGLNDAIRSAASCPARRVVLRALPAALKKRRGQQLFSISRLF